MTNPQTVSSFDTHILAFDTSGPFCACTTAREDVVLNSLSEPMQRGQAERLLPQIEALLAQQGWQWCDVDLIAVGIGPGNFTGVRISVATARALALSLNRPALGVSAFEAVLDRDGPLSQPAEIISLPAPRDQAYVQHFRYGVAQSSPRLIDPADPPRDLELPINMIVRGHRAAEIAKPFHAQAQEIAADGTADQIARMAHLRLETGADTLARPAPLYVRPADAAPPADPPPRVIP